MSNIFGNDDIDFDRAASAFPDISLDGSGDIPLVPSAPSVQLGDQDSDFFDAFDAVPPLPQQQQQQQTAVRVTGDDEIEKFESDFPEIDVPVSRRSVDDAQDGELTRAVASAYPASAPVYVQLCAYVCAKASAFSYTHLESERGRRRA